jgi:hypothetical protein
MTTGNAGSAPAPQPTVPNYDIHARCYLKRARAQLDAQTPEGIFYAAFELRCGIESRLSQYLAVQEENDGLVKQGWHVARLAARLNEHFGTGDKYVRLIVRQPGGARPYVLLYTPVTKKLVKMCQKLGDLMHIAKQGYRPDDPWWSSTRKWLGEVWVELCKAARGNLLGVPLLNPEDGSMHFNTEPAPDEPFSRHEAAIGPMDQEVRISVSYLDDIPENAYPIYP